MKDLLEAKWKLGVWLLFVVLALFAVSRYFSSSGTPADAPEDLSAYQILDKEVSGNSMYPLLKDGDKVQVIVGYYRDHAPRKWDIVAYNYGGRWVAIIKMVMVTDEDEVELDGSNLRVNGRILTNSAREAYSFSAWETKMLSLYIRDGRIPKDSFFIFGDNVVESTDSRKFGAVAASDFLGKFIRQ